MTTSPSPAPAGCPPLYLRLRSRESHKGDFGRVLVVGGSRGMCGSIALSAMAALRTGSGLVSAFVPNRCVETVAGFEPGVMTIAAPDNSVGQFAFAAAATVRSLLESCSAIAVGPGMGTGVGSIGLVRLIAQVDAIPRVFDADALNVIGRTAGLAVRGPAVFTPHPGELQRLCGVSAKDRPGQINAAVRLASDLGIVVLLKGASTFVTDGTQRWNNSTGNPGMASGGSGDCLTGIIASLLGQQYSPWDAARLGAFIHGLAGDLAADALGEAGMIASDILMHLPHAIRQVTAAA